VLTDLATVTTPIAFSTGASQGVLFQLEVTLTKTLIIASLPNQGVTVSHILAGGDETTFPVSATQVGMVMPVSLASTRVRSFMVAPS